MQKLVLALTPEEAVQAICLDLRRYDTQTMLCAELLKLLSDGTTTVKRDPQRDGVWIQDPRHPKMHYLEDAHLVEYLCTLLHGISLEPHQLAGICRRVFQTPTHIVPLEGTGRVSIHIETGMEDYRCRMCGHCCRHLDYHKEVEATDVTRWQSQGRSDILEWVGITKGDNGQPVYRIWINPGTNQYAQTCPFIKRGPSNNQWVCAIQETKPHICRHYPSTRKHAVMTGCKGFNG